MLINFVTEMRYIRMDKLDDNLSSSPKMLKTPAEKYRIYSFKLHIELTQRNSPV